MTSIKRIDLTDLIEPYAGKWVALTPDETTVLAASEDLDEALREAKAKGYSRPFLIKSPGFEMGGFFL